MSVGNRDTLIVFEQRTITQDPDDGTTIEGDWAEASRAWAEVRDILPSRAETVDEGVSMQRRPARIRVDYFDGADVTPDMRIDINGRKLRINGAPAFKRDTSEWEMLAEELSTAGAEP